MQHMAALEASGQCSASASPSGALVIDAGYVEGISLLDHGHAARVLVVKEVTVQHGVPAQKNHRAMMNCLKGRKPAA